MKHTSKIRFRTKNDFYHFWKKPSRDVLTLKYRKNLEKCLESGIFFLVREILKHNNLTAKSLMTIVDAYCW